MLYFIIFHKTISNLVCLSTSNILLCSLFFPALFFWADSWRGCAAHSASVPLHTPQQALPLLTTLGSIIFDDNSSSRIRFHFHKYISILTFATLWVLKKTYFQVLFPFLEIKQHCFEPLTPSNTWFSHLFHFYVHGSLLPWLRALNVEFHTRVFQPIFHIFNKTVEKMKAQV